MMDVSDLNGMAIVSLDEGARLGRIKQPLFDVTTRRLGALEVTGDDGTFVIPFDQIQSIGSDAVTVTSSQVTQVASHGAAQGSLRSLNDLKKLKIVDEAGTFLGTIDALEIDSTSGELTRLVAHKGGLLGVGGTHTPIEVASILTVGADIVTVSTT